MASKCDLGIFPFLLTPQVARQAISQQGHAQNLRKPLQESAVNQIQKVESRSPNIVNLFNQESKKAIIPDRRHPERGSK